MIFTKTYLSDSVYIRKIFRHLWGLKCFKTDETLATIETEPYRVIVKKYDTWSFLL